MARGGKAVGKPRPCCGKCRLTGLLRMEAGWECITCGVPWDGSEVSADHLPAALERQIAQGWVSRQEAFQAFLRMDDLAQAAADGDITFEQGDQLVALSA